MSKNNNKKFTVFCKIIDYVDAVDAEFADIIRITCCEPLLNPSKTRVGVTFLMPEESVRKEIIDKAYSADVNVATVAGKMIQSLIITNLNLKPADFKNEKNLQNAVSPAQEVKVKEISGEHIVFENGAKAKLSPSFKSALRYSFADKRDEPKSIAVWDLTGNIYDPKAKIAERRMPAKRVMTNGVKRIAGGYDETAIYGEHRARLDIARDIEKKYLAYEGLRRTGTSVPDVYRVCILSLLSFLKENDENVFDRVMPLVSLDKIDIYLLLQAHNKDRNENLIPLTLVEEWWVKCQNFQAVDVLGCESIVRKWMNDNKSVRLEKLAERKRLIKNCGNGLELIKCVIKIYGNYDTQNPNKMVQDEVRFRASALFCNFEEDKVLDKGRFKFITNYIADTLYDSRNNILNQEIAQMSIMPIEQYKSVERFIKSSWCLYYPAFKSEISGYREGVDAEFITENTKTV
jgi:hypothetical protein